MNINVKMGPVKVLYKVDDSNFVFKVKLKKNVLTKIYEWVRNAIERMLLHLLLKPTPHFM
uniref:Aminopeptidase N n=1 Tax=Sphingobacterium sp. (strain 21) TaxID=743722 RepID=F4C2E3_SPHS2